MKIVRVVCCFCLLLVGILAILQPTSVLGQVMVEGEERFRMSVKYPKIVATAAESFEFTDVKIDYLTYQGQGEPRLFDFEITAPKGWTVYITEQYQKDQRIAAIRIDPGLAAPAMVRLVAVPPYALIAEPGEYAITMEATGTGQEGDELKASVELTAVIEAVYFLDVVSPTERYNTSATANRDNYFSLELQNNGSAVIEDITFSSDKPEGWTIEFSPDKVDSISALNFRAVEVNIKPPPRTISGDYLIFITANGEQTSAQKIEIRVTVETAAVGVWVGIVIILLVIAGLAYTIRRLGRR